MSLTSEAYIGERELIAALHNLRYPSADEWNRKAAYARERRKQGHTSLLANWKAKQSTINMYSDRINNVTVV